MGTRAAMILRYADGLCSRQDAIALSPYDPKSSASASMKLSFNRCFARNPNFEKYFLNTYYSFVQISNT